MIKLADLIKECGDCERQGVDYTHGHDHEASMAESELRDLISNASKLQNIIQPGDQLPGWVSAYISLASDYMHSVAEYMIQQQAEMGDQGEEATPGYIVYEADKVGSNEYPLIVTKDPDYPTFLIVKIKYSTGSGGALTALGTTTVSGDERKQGAAEALVTANKVAEKLKKQYKLKKGEIEVSDLQNGTVQVFATSDRFVDADPQKIQQFLKNKYD